MVATKSTWFGGGAGVVVKAAAVVGFWVCERERERERVFGWEFGSVRESES